MRQKDFRGQANSTEGEVLGVCVGGGGSPQFLHLRNLAVVSRASFGIVVTKLVLGRLNKVESAT